MNKLNENQRYISQEQVDSFCKKTKENFDIDIKTGDEYMSMYSVFEILNEKFYKKKE